MKTKLYSLLYFQQLCDKYSKWIFPLHEGENIIGSDKNVDIFLYLNKKEDNIESVHCKIIIDEYKNNIDIISLTDKGFVKIIEKDKEIKLDPGKIYKLKNNSIFYLTDNLKFILIKGTSDEIKKYFIEQRLENEYQKWYELIINQKNNVKINLNLNLQRKDSLNNTIISNISNNNNNNNIINRSNTKEINRIRFNNFDEVLDDNLLNNDNNNIHFSPIKKDIIDSFLEINKNGKNKDEIKNEIKNENNNEDNNDNINNKKIENENIMNNKEDNIIKKNNNKIKENTNNDMILYRKSSFENVNNKENEYEEKIINKDEKAIKLIKELLGENNLDIIIKNTNFKKIKKYDIYIKKSKIDKGNFDIKFDNTSYIDIKKNLNKK